jgi:hypothetical protein
MKLLPGLWFLIFLIAVPATRAQQVYRDFDLTSSLSNYKSFAVFHREKHGVETEQELQFARVAESVVEQEIGKHNLIKRSVDEADLLIVCYVFAQDKRVLMRLPYDETQLNIWSDIRNWQREGNLVVDLIDSKSNRLVWRGIALRILKPNGENTKPIKKAMTRLFKKYPNSRKGYEMDYGRQGFYLVLVPVAVVSLVRILLK